MSTQHTATPRPWAMAFRGGRVYDIRALNENARIAVMPARANKHIIEANAILIVCAVNQRPQLLECLRAALDWIPTLDQVSKNDYESLAAFRSEVGALLRKAQEGA